MEREGEGWGGGTGGDQPLLKGVVKMTKGGGGWSSRWRAP
jgi:hypothetical protein